MTSKADKEESSFRDPSGFIFYQDKNIYRQINTCYKEDFDFLIQSNLYHLLAKDGLLITHQEVPAKENHNGNKVYKTLKVTNIPLISYPYEWSFSQLKDAALTTLKIQKLCLEHGMILKDASAYNIQFLEGRPIFIDTLSFEKYEDGQPWKAYRQFCQHFLAPLVLMSYKDIRFNQLLKIYLDGVPLDMVSKLLPKKSWLSPSLLSHIHLHAKSQQHFSSKKTSLKKYRLSKNSLLALTDNLEGIIKNLKLRKTNTEWGEYYNFTNYSQTAFNHKKKIIDSFLSLTNSKSVWDLGANNGEFSKIAASRKILTYSFDIDPLAVEKNYLGIKESGNKYLLPLLMDLTNPSPSIGWNNLERKNLMQRGPTSTIFALALIHHLAISNNLPFENIAQFFSQLGEWLIIEFVPKEDSQVQILLSSREDIFPNYNEEFFEKFFKKFYKVVKKEQVTDSQRTMYLMKKQT